MREILFRGKRVDNGEWVEGYYVKAEHHWHEKGIHEDWIVTGASQNGGWFTLQGRYAVIPESIGQYTALKDKNGKRVFEGDIIKNEYSKGKYQYLKIVYSQKDYSWIVKNGYGWSGYLYSIIGGFEVIGNIHDNSELLEG